MDVFYHYIVGKILFVSLTKYFGIHYRKAILSVFLVALLKEIYDNYEYNSPVLESIKNIFFTMVGCL